MSNKATKRSLILSVISLIVCCAMLIGSTFAWFTDNVSTGANQIVAGNLDVELYYQNVAMADFAPVSDTTSDLFVSSEGGEIKWEPGAAAVTYLRLSNAGSLALKYQLSVAASDTAVGADGAALSKVLKTAAVEIAADEVGSFSRDDAIAKATAAGAGSVLTYSKQSELAAGAQPLYFALVVYYPYELGNVVDGLVYNRSDVELATELTVKLTAAQAVSESDSFSNDYDQGAQLPVVNSQSLTSALKAGGIVTLGSDIEYSADTNPDIDTADQRVVLTRSTVLDLSDKTITFDSGAGANNFAAFYLSSGFANVTVEGDGTIDAISNTGGYCFHLYGSLLSRPKLTINGGTYIGTPTAVNVQHGTAYINGGFYDCRPATTVTEDVYRYTLNCYDDNYKNGSAKIIVTGGTFVNFNPADNQAEGPGTNFVAEGYTVVPETQANGDIWYTVVPE